MILKFSTVTEDACLLGLTLCHAAGISYVTMQVHHRQCLKLNIKIMAALA